MHDYIADRYTHRFTLIRQYKSLLDKILNKAVEMILLLCVRF